MFIGTVVGRLGSDATIKDIKGNTTIQFDIAVTNPFKKTDDVTEWVHCVKWGNQGKLIDFLQKGTTVCVTGEVKQRFFKKSDGSNGFALEINVSTLELIGDKKIERQEKEEDEDGDLPF